MLSYVSTCDVKH